MKYLRLFTSLYFLFLFMGFSIGSLSAQGCSDAGFCTMGAMRPSQKFQKKASIKLRSIEVSHYYAYNRFGDEFYAYTLDANVALGEKSQMQFKIPYMRVNGLIADTKGLSDISLSFTHNLLSKEYLQINATIGAKIPTGKPQKQWKGRDLPMYYQTTLGTFDFVAGVSLINRKWLVATGIQQTLTTTDNRFVRSEWKGTNWWETSGEYPPSSFNLKRGTDIMLRVERDFRFSKFNIGAGILTIYRLNKDIVDFVDGTTESGRGKLERTDGPAITGLAHVGYHLTPRSSIKVTLGHRIKKRHYNPDGLSRELVNTVSYEFKF